MNTVLIVAAHTDDEALGCGGTIVRHVAEGDTVYAVFMADGVTSRSNEGDDARGSRNAAAAKAKEIMGIKEIYHLGLPDNRMDSIPLIDAVQKLEPLIDKLKPNIVYTHHPGDLNVDHRIAHQAVMTACRPMPGNSVRSIFAFEIISSTEWATPGQSTFVPNHFVNITDYLHIKIEALNAYKIEMRSAPHSRSIAHVKILANHRGMSVGVDAAEAFSVVRSLS